MRHRPVGEGCLQLERPYSLMPHQAQGFKGAFERVVDFEGEVFLGHFIARIQPVFALFEDIFAAR